MCDCFGGSLFKEGFNMENEIITEAVQPDTPEPQTQIEQPTNNNTPNAYETIIAQQQAQIEALIAQSNTLTQQITNMVNNGAQFNTQPYVPQWYTQVSTDPQSAFNPKSLAETDAFLSMEDLAKDIGKR